MDRVEALCPICGKHRGSKGHPSRLHSAMTQRRGFSAPPSPKAPTAAFRQYERRADGSFRRVE